MPLNRYFKGHGREVMASMRKAHPDYSEERIKAEFYATVNKRKKQARKALRGH